MEYKEHKKSPPIHDNRWVNKKEILSNTHSYYQNNSDIAHDMKIIDNNTNDSWEVPIALDSNQLENFPNNIFPPWLDNFIKGVAEESQTPIASSAFTALTALSSVLNKKYKINIRGNWYEYLNIYLIMALDSGHRKSFIYSEFMKPILNYEIEKKREFNSMSAEKKEIIKTHELCLSELESKYGKSPNKKTLEDIKKLAKENSELKSSIAARPKLIASDATPEKIAVILFEQNERLTLASPEGAEVIEIAAGRYNNRPNQDLYLKAFSSESFDVERLSREPIHLESPSLVIGLFVQLSVLQSMPIEFSNRGLTQRFLYSIPDSLLGYRKVNPPVTPDHIRLEYMKKMNKLLPFNKDEKIKTLTLSEDALNYLIIEQFEIEKKLRNKNLNEGMIGWLSKLIGQILRISGIIHMAENIENDSINLVIEKQTLKKAFGLKKYLISHAEKAFGLIGTSQKTTDLEYLLDIIIEKSQINQSFIITYREIFESTKRRFKNAATFKIKLKELEDYYWIKQFKNGKQFIKLNPNYNS